MVMLAGLEFVFVRRVFFRGRSFWWLGLLIGGMIAGPAKISADGRPNVLFLFADDMRADSIAALGQPDIRTPNLDQLVRRGFVFRNAYCLGANMGAVCTPSRNMLLSGNAYFRWQNPSSPAGKTPRPVGLAPAEGPNFPRLMNEAGYITYHHGKKGNTATLIQGLFHTNKYLVNDEAERRSGEPGKIIVDEAIEFLKQDHQGRPFCMYLAFANPHDPRVAAAAYLNQYQPEALRLPANFLPVHPFNNGEMEVRDEQLSPWPRTESDIRATLHAYYATTTALDFHIGRLLRALDEQGLTDKTLVVFSADHGIAVGSHGLLGKQNLYEHSMKAPLVFAGPGVPQGSSAALLYLMDICPTICDLVGITPPKELDGRSVKPVILGERTDHRSELLLAYRDVQRALREPRWKLIRYPQIDFTHLFDLEQDPQELFNLADRPEHASRISTMRARMQELQQELGDTQAWSSTHVAPRHWTPPHRGN